VCSKCTDLCSICNEAHHKPHVAKCNLCGRKLCPKCGKTCSHCRAAVCPEHVVPLSRGREFCVACFRQRERMIMRVAVPAVIGGVTLVVLLIYYFMLR
jgi:hypothetical protein